MRCGFVRWRLCGGWGQGRQQVGPGAASSALSLRGPLPPPGMPPLLQNYAASDPSKLSTLVDQLYKLAAASRNSPGPLHQASGPGPAAAPAAAAQGGGLGGFPGFDLQPRQPAGFGGGGGGGGGGAPFGGLAAGPGPAVKAEPWPQQAPAWQQQQQQQQQGPYQQAAAVKQEAQQGKGWQGRGSLSLSGWLTADSPQWGQQSLQAAHQAQQAQQQQAPQQQGQQQGQWDSDGINLLRNLLASRPPTSQPASAAGAAGSSFAGGASGSTLGLQGWAASSFGSAGNNSALGPQAQHPGLAAFMAQLPQASSQRSLSMAAPASPSPGAGEPGAALPSDDQSQPSGR